MAIIRTTVLGYPRIGLRRELKRAVEAYWSGTSDADALAQTAAHLRRTTWETLRDAGLDEIPSNTFSLYDHVLDHAVLFDAIPARFADLTGLERYFAMARGTSGVAPLEMTKWFDTNYHYLVPELKPDTTFCLDRTHNKPVEEYRAAASLGITTRPVLLGPVSFLLLSKPAADAPKDFRTLDLLDGLLEVYRELLAELAAHGAPWVQLDEPVLAADRTPDELNAVRMAYERLAAVPVGTERPKIVVASYFAPLDTALPVLARTPIDGIALDLVAGARDLDRVASAGLAGKTVFAGLVDGRNVWRCALAAALSTAASLLGSVGELVVSTSCSLMHVPLDLDQETSLPADLRSRLAFARQKVDEVVLLGRALREGRSAIEPELTAASEALATPVAGAVDARVRARLEALGEGTRRSD